MDEVQKQIALGAIRLLLGAVGAAMVTRGWIPNEVLNDSIGAMVTLIALVWSALDKVWSEKKAQARELAALNAGVTLSNSTPSPTPQVGKEEAQTIIRTFGDKQ